MYGYFISHYFLNNNYTTFFMTGKERTCHAFCFMLNFLTLLLMICINFSVIQIWCRFLKFMIIKRIAYRFLFSASPTISRNYLYSEF